MYKFETVATKERFRDTRWTMTTVTSMSQKVRTKRRLTFLSPTPPEKLVSLLFCTTREGSRVPHTHPPGIYSVPQWCTTVFHRIVKLRFLRRVHEEPPDFLAGCIARTRGLQHTSGYHFSLFTFWYSYARPEEERGIYFSLISRKYACKTHLVQKPPTDI